MAWITIPNIFGGKTGAPVTEIDADFAAITTALNTFNPTGQAFSQAGVSAVRGLLGANGSSPNTQYDLSVDFLVARDPATGALFNQDTVVTTTNDVSVAGPIINGRDQAGAFSPSSWVHLYWIADPAGFAVATISSIVPPPVGPTLPTSYTSWAYAGAVRIDGGGNLVSTWMRGAQAFYSEAVQVVNTGATVINTETAVPLVNQIPPNALSVFLTAAIILTNGGTSGFVLDLRSNSGLTAVTMRGSVTAATPGSVALQAVLPNVAQNYFYLWNVDTPVGAALTETQQWVNGYRIANGDA